MSIIQDDLSRAPPESVGCRSRDILSFLDDVAQSDIELHSVVMYKASSVIAEGWYWPYERDMPHTMHSATKSFLSVAVGLAIHENYFSLTDRVVSFFPDRFDVSTDHGFLSLMTVEDLLTQTAGHGHGESGGEWRGIETSWVDKFFSIPVEHEPGSKFTYSSATSFMLSAIISNTTGLSARDFLEPRLFQPLGIRFLTWDSSPEGISSGGNGISCCSSDLLKLGILHLQKGMWRGQRILPLDWVQAATTPQRGNQYGYHWWTNSAAGTYRASGFFGQYAIVYPEHDSILVTTAAVGSGARALDLVINRHFPALWKPKASNITLDNENSQLTQRLATLRVSLPLLQGTTNNQTRPPLMNIICGRRFLARSNNDDIITFTLDMRAFNNGSQRGILHVQDSRGFHRIDFGLYNYLDGFTTLPGPKLHHGYQPTQLRTMAGGRWTAEDKLEINVQYQETPFRDTIALRFLCGARIARLDRRVNVNSFSVRRPTVWAHILSSTETSELESLLSEAVKAARPSPRWSVAESTVGELLDNEATRAVLDELIPHVVNSPRIDKARLYTFEAVARYVDGLDDDLLCRIDNRLAKTRN